MDNPDIELPGPWSHRYISANGARFHVCESLPEPSVGPNPTAAPLVVLLHGFPEFWWAWRHQLPVLAAAGYHAVAMDLRGYGASDKTPRGYDPLTLSADVTGVIRGMGAPVSSGCRARMGRLRRMDGRCPARPDVRERPVCRVRPASKATDQYAPMAASEPAGASSAGDADAVAAGAADRPELVRG